VSQGETRSTFCQFIATVPCVARHAAATGDGRSVYGDGRADLGVAEHLSLPGTHDTMAQYGDPSDQTGVLDLFIVTQTISLSQQLTSGSRAIDIRLQQSGSTLVCTHAWYPQNTEFGKDVLTVAVSFVTAHPGETIVMRMKNR
jgi:1-phosphatidylinositol phosphodiesterase